MSDHSKVDLILNNFYSKTLHLLLESRVSLPETKSRISKWFNIQTTDSGSNLFKSELSTWKNLSTSTQVPPMVIEFILDATDIPPNQACLFVDAQGRRSTVQSSLVLERWTLQLSGAGAQEDLPIVYKRSIVLFRALYTLLRVLPLYTFIRRLRRSHSRGLNIGCRLSAEYSKPTQSDGILPIDAQLSQDAQSNLSDTHRFNAITTPAGILNLSVEYRCHTNFVVDDIESLLSSRFVDEDYYTPTLTKHRSTPSAGSSGTSGVFPIPAVSDENKEEGNVVRDYVARTGASRVRANSSLSPRTTSYISTSPSVRPMSLYSGASPTPSLTGIVAQSYQRQGAAISIPENQSSSSSTTRRYSSSFGYRRNSSIGGGSSGESLIKPLASPNQPSPPPPSGVSVSRKQSTKLSQSLAEEEGHDDNDIGDFIKLIDQKPQLRSVQETSSATISKQQLDEKIRMMSVSSLANSSVKEEEKQDFGEVVGQMDFDELDIRRSMSAPIATTSQTKLHTGVATALTAAGSPDDNAVPFYYDVGASRGRSSSRRNEKENPGKL